MADAALKVNKREVTGKKTRFLRRAGAVVDGDDGLCIDAGIGDDMDEIGE